MSKSTKLITSAYIMSFVASNAPKRLNTDKIAEMVQAHPTRVRHITSRLVKAGLLTSYRGGKGGLILAKDPKDISLRDIHDAIQDQPLLPFGMHDPFSQWADHCFVRTTFQTLYGDLEDKLLRDLEDIKVSHLYVPWHTDGEISHNSPVKELVSGKAAR